MNEEDHLTYLSWLKARYVRNPESIIPISEGAFYFEGDLSYKEYVDKYEEECVQKGWIVQE